MQKKKRQRQEHRTCLRRAFNYQKDADLDSYICVQCTGADIWSLATEVQTEMDRIHLHRPGTRCARSGHLARSRGVLRSFGQEPCRRGSCHLKYASTQ